MRRCYGSAGTEWQDRQVDHRRERGVPVAGHKLWALRVDVFSRPDELFEACDQRFPDGRGVLGLDTLPGQGVPERRRATRVFGRCRGGQGLRVRSANMLETVWSAGGGCWADHSIDCKLKFGSNALFGDRTFRTPSQSPNSPPMKASVGAVLILLANHLFEPRF